MKSNCLARSTHLQYDYHRRMYRLAQHRLMCRLEQHRLVQRMQLVSLQEKESQDEFNKYYSPNYSNFFQIIRIFMHTSLHKCVFPPMTSKSVRLNLLCKIIVRIYFTISCIREKAN